MSELLLRDLQVHYSTTIYVHTMDISEVKSLKRVLIFCFMKPAPNYG